MLRIFDLLIAMFLGLFCLPIFLLIGSLVYLDSGLPIIYRQDRVGKNCRVFSLFKFRTMIRNAENMGAELRVIENDPRITRTGTFLRKWSLDELPQLINVIKGDMSMVGPRPIVVKHLSRLTVDQNQRHKIRPGITGLAQVTGRKSLSWPQRFEYDLQYVKRNNLFLYFQIIFKTFIVILSNKDVYNSKKSWR